METSILNFLSSLASTVFRLAAICFVLVNCAALLAFGMSRSRRMVNTWTPRLVTIDAVLLGTGLGVPLLAAVARLGVHALARMAAGALALFK
jgi:hypothetical protein